MPDATMEKPQSAAMKQGFKELTGSSGATLFVAGKKANHAESMKMITEGNLRALKYQEALLLLTKDEALKNALKGKWFYLDGAGIDKSGFFTINSKGEIVECKDNESIENEVYVWNGTNPLSVNVGSDDDAAEGGRRFILVANYEPVYVAPVVVGVAKDFKLDLKAEPTPAESHEAAAPKIPVELRASAEESVAKLEAAEQAGAIPAGITAPLREMLRMLN